MGLLALFLFIVLPVIEIYLFIEIGGALGAGWTIVLIFLTAAIGVSAMRRQGLAVLQEAQAAQHAGRPPLAAVAHGVLILLGGLLLLVPGFSRTVWAFCACGDRRGCFYCRSFGGAIAAYYPHAPNAQRKPSIAHGARKRR